MAKVDLTKLSVPALREEFFRLFNSHSGAMHRGFYELAEEEYQRMRPVLDEFCRRAKENES